MSWAGLVNATETSDISFLINAEDSESLLSYDAEGSSYEDNIQDTLSSTTTVEASTSPEANKIHSNSTNSILVAPHKEESPLYRGATVDSPALSSPFDLHLAHFTIPQEIASGGSNREASLAKQREDQRIADRTAALIEELVIDLGVDEEVSNADLHAQELAYQQDLFEASQREKRPTLRGSAHLQDRAGVDIFTLKMSKRPKMTKIRLIDETFSGPLSEKNGVSRKGKVAVEVEDNCARVNLKQRTVPELQPAPRPSAVAASHHKKAKVQTAQREGSEGDISIVERYAARQNVDATRADAIARALFGDEKAAYLGSKYDYSFEIYSDGKSLGTIEHQTNGIEVASQTVEEEAPILVASERLEKASEALGATCTEAGIQYEDDKEEEIEPIEDKQQGIVAVTFDESPRERCRSTYGGMYSKDVDLMLVIEPKSLVCHVCHRSSGVEVDGRDTVISGEKVASTRDEMNMDVVIANEGKEVSLEMLPLISAEAQEMNQSNEANQGAGQSTLDLQPGSDEEQVIDALQTLCQGPIAEENKMDAAQYYSVSSSDAIEESAIGSERGGSRGTNDIATDAQNAVKANNEGMTQDNMTAEATDNSQLMMEPKLSKKGERKRLRAIAMEYNPPRTSGRTKNSSINYNESSRSKVETRKIKEEPETQELMPPTPSSPLLDYAMGSRAAKRKAAEMISSSSTGCLYGGSKSTLQHPKKKRGRTTT